MYFELLKELAPLDRCHCGPEMEIAYQKLVAHLLVLEPDMHEVLGRPNAVDK